MEASVQRVSWKWCAWGDRSDGSVEKLLYLISRDIECVFTWSDALEMAGAKWP